MGATLPSAIAVGEQSGAASLMSRRRRTDHEHERESGLVTAGAELRLLRVKPSTCVTCSWWCAGHVVSVTGALELASCCSAASLAGRAGRVAPLGGVVVGIAVPDVHKRSAEIANRWRELRQEAGVGRAGRAVTAAPSFATRHDGHTAATGWPPALPNDAQAALHRHAVYHGDIAGWHFSSGG